MAQVELVNVRGSRVMPTLPSWLAFTQGNIWHVKPYSGSDSNKGDRPDRALKTLSQAQTLATADQNDIVLLYSESNTAASTTDYQSSTLDWAKDGVHLIGVNSGSAWSQRSRVALISTYATASNLFTLSADNCYIANVAFFAGVADTSPTGCFKMTGDRNVVENCHIAGIGNDNNDIAGAYSLFCDGVEESTFRRCKIGLNTIAAGSAANSEILFDTSCKNIEFDDCVIYRRVEHATNHPLVKFADATAMDEFILFNQCKFIHTAVNYGVTASSVFKFAATPTAGLVVLYYPIGVNDNASGAGKWDVDDLDKICVIGSATPAADTCGLVRVV
jgi:hypothetical protein